MIKKTKRAHIQCDTCNADIVFDKEDIQTKEETETEYGRGSWEKTRYYKITTYFIICPVCDTQHVIKKTREETSSCW